MEGKENDLAATREAGMGLPNAVPSVRLLGVPVPLKYVSLCVLVVQMSMMVLALRGSRQSSDPYITSTAVFLSEIIKLFTCLCLVLNEERSAVKFTTVIREQVLGTGWESLKIFVPACLYVVQNNLLFIALSYLDAGTYQVTYQLKILTTAFFSVALLRRSLSFEKWGSLFILTIGVALVQLASIGKSTSAANQDQQLLGLMITLTACLISGFAGVYLELVLKTSRPSVWVRNVQLSLFSIIPSGIAVLWTDGDRVAELGFFHGYTFLTICVVLLQACSGLIVAVVVKYADNILKGFGAAISILVSSVGSIFLFGFRPSWVWAGGVFFVMVATALYSLPDPTPSRPSSGPPLLPVHNKDALEKI